MLSFFNVNSISEMIEEIKRLSNEYFQEILEIRRYLHKHPELSFNEFQTSKYIKAYIIELGY